MRTEEAVLITLSSLAEKIDPIEAPPEFKLKDLIAQSEDTGNVQKVGEPMKRKSKVKKRRSDAPKDEFSGTNGHANGLNANDDDINDDMSRFD